MITAHYTTGWITNGALRYRIEIQQVDGTAWRQRHTFQAHDGVTVDDWLSIREPVNLRGFTRQGVKEYGRAHDSTVEP